VPKKIKFFLAIKAEYQDSTLQQHIPFLNIELHLLSAGRFTELGGKVMNS
jgi:hypothetical protein